MAKSYIFINFPPENITTSMRNSIIGREKEIKELEDYIASDHSEFIAVYGRRRVGKTFLIKEMFEGKALSLA